MAKFTTKDITSAMSQATGKDVDGLAIAQAIYNSASPQLKSAIPAPRVGNAVEIGQGLLQYPDTLASEWVTLASRIGRVIAHDKMLTNKLADFKRGPMPQGYTIEEYYVDVCEEHEFNPSLAETNQFKRELPNVKTLFHTVNRKSFYKQTIEDDVLRSYFVDWSGQERMIASIVNALYKSDNKDDYNYMKRVLTEYYDKGYMRVVPVTKVTNEESARALAIAITTYAGYLTEPTAEYNAMGVTTQSEMEDLYIVVTSPVNAQLNINWLAQTFQLDIASFKAHILLIPTLPSVTNGEIQAMVIDRDLYMVLDQLYKVTVKYNGEGLYWNYWLHHWEVLSASRFANAIAFVAGDVAKVTGVIVSPAIGAVRKGDTIQLTAQVNTTSSDIDTTVTWDVAGGGDGTTVDENGLLTVAETETATELTVTAISTALTSVKGTSTIAVLPAAEV